jgi:NAD(P)-dependent dehydrogenase (short-subunit alcohol dehydrogenase family)
LSILIIGSSGIGRAVAILFAREGADVSIVYLPVEQEDAEETKKLVETEGKQCLLIPGDLMKNEFCKQAIDKHQDKSVVIILRGNFGF